MKPKSSWDRKWHRWPVNQRPIGRHFIPEKTQLNKRGERPPKAPAAGNQAPWRNRSRFSCSLDGIFLIHAARSCERVEQPLDGPLWGRLSQFIGSERKKKKKKNFLCQWVSLGHVTTPRKTMCVGETTTRPRPHFLESGSKVGGWVGRRRLFQCAATERPRDQRPCRTGNVSLLTRCCANELSVHRVIALAVFTSYSSCVYKLETSSM